MTKSTFTLSIDADLKTQFSAAAEAAASNGEQVLIDYMLAYVRQHRGPDGMSYDSWLEKKILHARDQVAAGDVISNEDVEEESRVWREQAARKLADSAS